MKLKDFLEVIDYRITEGSEFLWDCYGPNVHRIERQCSDSYTGNTITCVFDTREHFIYEMEAWDNYNDRVYRWIHPNYVDSYKKECKARDVDFKQAYDNINFIDVDTEQDILDKSRAISNGEEYDTRVEVPLTLEDDVLFALMKEAHQRDITLNQLVEVVLTDTIEEFRRTGPVVQYPPFPATNFTQEQAREVVRKVKKKKEK